MTAIGGRKGAVVGDGNQWLLDPASLEPRRAASDEEAKVTAEPTRRPREASLSAATFIG